LNQGASSGVGVKFAQSFSQWKATADTWRNVLNPADREKARKPGLSTVHALNIIKTTASRINHEKYTFSY
jgi:hypothetical protein